MHSFIFELDPVVFKHLRVSQAARVINFHLKHLFYIDINKNMISCFNTLKMLFLILLLKKVTHPSFLIHCGKRIEDKWWLGWGGLGRCDR